MAISKNKCGSCVSRLSEVTGQEDIEICFNGVDYKSNTQDLFLRIFCELMPCGTVIPWTGTTVPVGWLETNGATFTSTTYPELVTCLGGNVLPDFRGRIPIGSGGVYPTTLGTTGGQSFFNMSVAQMPLHTHNYTDLYRQANTNDNKESSNNFPNANPAGSKTDVRRSTFTGGGEPIGNLQKTFLTNFIIKACPAILTDLGAVGAPTVFNGTPVNTPPETDPIFVDTGDVIDDFFGEYVNTAVFANCNQNICVDLDVENTSNASTTNIKLEFTKDLVDEIWLATLPPTIGINTAPLDFILNEFDNNDGDGVRWRVYTIVGTSISEFALSDSFDPMRCPYDETWSNFFDATNPAVRYKFNSITAGVCPI